MKGLINILKFIFAISIFLLHSEVYFANGLFQGAYIYVDWFFVFAGYTLARKVESNFETHNIATTSFEIIFERIMRVFPYFAVSSILALCVKLCFKELVIESAWDINKIIHEILMLQMTTIPVITLTGTAWFTSSMLIAMVLIVPIFLKLKKKFYIIALIIATLIYLYIYKVSGYLWHPIEWFITYKGNLRAIAGISIGIFGYGLSPYVKRFLNNVKDDRKIEYLIILAYILIYYYVFKVTESGYYFVLPYIFMVLITINMNLNNDSVVPDNKYTRAMGQFSLVLYMNHYYIIEVIAYAYPLLDSRLKFAFAALFSVFTSLLVFCVVSSFSKLRSRLKSGQ